MKSSIVVTGADTLGMGNCYANVHTDTYSWLNDNYQEETSGSSVLLHVW